ncbi:hypothetical protein Y032_0701g1648 [Ancylostoma ceylanicum]|uniref:Uncharacterized protein n=1 Tax=Ancylostoma ceylanicum TaxID=53326 RepID=A0A016WGD3_9BILA|nr:hypothetical protein Y032_0701g1648 [Ancylostoma ceylanicum]
MRLLKYLFSHEQSVITTPSVKTALGCIANFSNVARKQYHRTNFRPYKALLSLHSHNNEEGHRRNVVASRRSTNTALERSNKKLGQFSHDLVLSQFTQNLGRIKAKTGGRPNLTEIYREFKRDPPEVPIMHDSHETYPEFTRKPRNCEKHDSHRISQQIMRKPPAYNHQSLLR